MFKRQQDVADYEYPQTRQKNVKFQLQNKEECSMHSQNLEEGGVTNTVDLFSEIDSEINTSQHLMKSQSLACDQV